MGTGHHVDGRGTIIPPAAQVAVTKEPRLPLVTALARVFAVKDAGREWAVALAGQPVVPELEEQ
jgi:hypothetical protein